MAEQKSSISIFSTFPRNAAFFIAEPLRAFESIWALITFLTPQVVYVIMGIVDTLKEVKEDKTKKEQLERERLLQEQREELGKWK